MTVSANKDNAAQQPQVTGFDGKPESHILLRWSLLLGNFMRNAGFSSQVYHFPYRKNSIFHTSLLTWHQYSSFYVLLINTFRISEDPYFLKIKNKYFGFSD